MDTFNPPYKVDIDVSTGVETFFNAEGAVVEKAEVDAYAASLPVEAPEN